MAADEADIIARHFRVCLRRKDASQDTLDDLATYLTRRARDSLSNARSVVDYNRSDSAARSLLSQVSTSSAVPAQTLVDAAIAYPTHPTWMGSVITAQVALDPSVLDVLSRQVLEPLAAQLQTARAAREIGATAFALLALARSHDYLALRLAKLSASFGQIKGSYGALAGQRDQEAIRSKSHLLLLLHTILSGLPQTEREWKLVTLADEDEGKANAKATPLVDADLSADYKLFFVQDAGRTELDDQVLQTLRDIKAGAAAEQAPNTLPPQRGNLDESAIEPLTSLFPQIPPQLLLDALSHPAYAGSLPVERVEALTNALLSETLPAGLEELQRHVQSAAEQGAAQEAQSEAPRKMKRDNIFSSMPMDFSKLRVGKEDSSSEFPALTAGIPDHIRESILRLSQQQQEEEDAELAAEREAAAERRARHATKNGDMADRGGERETTRIVAFEEELEEDEEDTRGRAGGRGVVQDGEESDEGSDVVARGIDETPEDEGDPETMCELAYLWDPKLFDRDAGTRRSKARADLKVKTGWSDEQIEGWRIMLERNPRKNKILERHAYGAGAAAPNNRDVAPPPPRDNHRPRGGSERGGGGGRGGGGRGRGSKSSRGHQNAARTRGHDRKMQRMGGA